MSDMIIRTVGPVAHATLNRPKALNALNHQMCLDLETAMKDWAHNDNIKLLLIDAEGEKAFCAGGDIVGIYRQAMEGDYTSSLKFWRDEYRLNLAISTYSKPYIALMDRIVMGGGVGISSHGSHRIVTERTMFAMPECAIGLLPDVGGTYLLANMPGHSGEYVGLTGARLDGADCIYAGLADYYVHSDQLPALKSALIKTGDPAVISDFSSTPPASKLAAQQDEIDAVFMLESVAEIENACATSQADFAGMANKGLAHGAALSKICTLNAIREARKTGSLARALRTEYRFVSRIVKDGEFIEGVRAAVIDKDRNPKWQYQTLDAVPQDLIDRLGQPAPDGDFQP